MRNLYPHKNRQAVGDVNVDLKTPRRCASSKKTSANKKQEKEGSTVKSADDYLTLMDAKLRYTMEHHVPREHLHNEKKPRFNRNVRLEKILCDTLRNKRAQRFKHIKNDSTRAKYRYDTGVVIGHSVNGTPLKKVEVIMQEEGERSQILITMYPFDPDYKKNLITPLPIITPQPIKGRRGHVHLSVHPSIRRASRQDIRLSVRKLVTLVCASPKS